MIGTTLCHTNYGTLASKCNISTSFAAIVLIFGDIFTHILPVAFVLRDVLTQKSQKLNGADFIVAMMIYVFVPATWISLFDPEEVYDMLLLPDMTILITGGIGVSFVSITFLFYITNLKK